MGKDFLDIQYHFDTGYGTMADVRLDSNKNLDPAIFSYGSDSGNENDLDPDP